MANGSKAAAGNAPAKAPAKNAAAKKEGEKGAPRPRKWDYGIKDEAIIVRVKRTKEEGEPTLRGPMKDAYGHTEKNIAVADFLKLGGTRHDIRAMSRRQLINVKHSDGTVFPKEYEAPPPKAKAAPKDKIPNKAA